MAFSAKLIGANGSEHPLAATTRVGRSPDCDFVIDDEKVSRSHATINADAHRLVIEDLGSTNGTWVNGQRVREPVTLGDGDEVRFQRHKFLVRLQPEVTVQETAPSLRPAVSKSPEPPAGTQNIADAHLVVADDEGGRVVELPARRDGVWTIGRNEASDVVLVEPGIAGRHAQLLHKRKHWQLVNLVSASSTLVNGRKSEKAYLADGDEVRLGSATMVFHTAQTLVGFAKWRARLRKTAERFPKAFLAVRILTALLVFAAWVLNTDFDAIMQMVRDFEGRLAALFAD